jgi:hypothetical protein
MWMISRSVELLNAPRCFWKDFGTLKVQTRKFEHCGIQHIQNDNFEVLTHQNHYCLNLNPISLVDVCVDKPESPLTAAQHAQYLSLLGGVAWLNQTRLDVCIFTQALQRAAAKPQVQHLIRLNAVCKWVRRKEAWLNFRAIKGPVRILVIADAAFRREDVTGLAMRGHVICLAGPAFDANSVALQGDAAIETVGVQVLDWSAKRQKRVVRSTFAAELNSLADATEQGKLIALAITELTDPRLGPVPLAKALEDGTLAIGIDLFTDCRSIYDALKTDELRIPTEAGLYPLLLILKHLLKVGVVKRLYWIDTADMLADGLNKGSIARAALLQVPSSSQWILRFPAKWCRGTVGVAVPGDK